MQWRWRRTRRGYVVGSVNGIVVYLHRYIMKDKRNYMMIDHKNRNKLDNTKANLPEATPFQNNMKTSRVVTSKTSSLYHGVAKVVLSSGRVKWRVFFRRRHIGWFHTEHEAAHRYNVEHMATTGDPEGPNNVPPVELFPIVRGNANLPKGVSVSKDKFIANINGEKIHFDRVEDAIAARKAHEDELEKERRAEVFTRAITEDKDGNAIITLTNGMVSKVDHKRWHEVSLYSWYYFKGYACTTINGRCVSLHRFVRRLGPPNGHTLPVVDHLNRNNRLENLREATWSFNAFNRPKKQGTRSDFIGVCVSNSGSFREIICHQRKPYYLGIYDDEKLAAYAYDCKAEFFYGMRPNGIELTGYEFVNDRVQAEGSEPKVKKVKTSKYTGVCLEGKKWRAEFQHKGDVVYLGLFASELEAACAIDRARAQRGLKLVTGVGMLDGYEWRENQLIRKPGPDVVNVEEYYKSVLKVKKVKTSEYTGVSLIGKKWRASFKHKGDVVDLGRYALELEAACAVDCARAQLGLKLVTGVGMLDGYEWTGKKLIRKGTSQ